MKFFGNLDELLLNYVHKGWSSSGKSTISIFFTDAEELKLTFNSMSCIVSAS